LLVLPYLRTERGRIAWDRFKLRIPLLGNVMLMVSLCRFCRILGTMLHNGVPILQALKVSKDSAGNIVLAAQIEKAAEEVQKGRSLASPLGASGLFPLDIVDMIAVAEESNSLETVLVQIADSNESRTGRKIDLGVRLLEPIMLMFMAGIVMIIALALLVPIIRMSTSGLSH
jgi:type II secretory pathway component PulF